MKRAWTGLAGALVLATLACDNGGDVSSVLDLQVVPVEAIKTMPGRDANPAAGARIVQFIASGPGMSSRRTSYDYAAGGGALPSFPEGYDRQVTVEFCTDRCDPAAGGDIIARGSTAPMALFAGDQKHADVFVGPRNAVLPVVKVSAQGTTTTERTTLNRKERVGATATVLDDGRVLIVGGAKVRPGATTWFQPQDLDEVFGDAEIYDPRTGEFTQVGPLNERRAFHAAVKLGGPRKADGRVVVLGGLASSGGTFHPTASIELFDPRTNSFVMAEQETQWLAGAGRSHFTVDLAYPDDGVIAIAGGYSEPEGAGGTIDLYKVDYGTVGHWGLADASGVSDAARPGVVRWNHTMTLVPNYAKDADGNALGAYLIIGGENQGGTVDLVEAWLVDPVKKGFSLRLDASSVTRLPGGGRTMHASVLVPRHGIVYALGGFAGKGLSDPWDNARAYRIAQKGFNESEALPLGVAIGGMTATLVDATTILLTGGRGTSSDPSPRTFVIMETTYCWDDNGQQKCSLVPMAKLDQTPDMEVGRAGHLAVLEGTGRVLLLGGVGSGGIAPDPVIFNPE